MQFPFVSRGRFEDLQEQVSELKIERNRLQEQLETAQQDNMELLAKMAEIANDRPGSTMRLTGERVRSMANTAANQAAHGGHPLWTKGAKKNVS